MHNGQQSGPSLACSVGACPASTSQVQDLPTHLQRSGPEWGNLAEHEHQLKGTNYPTNCKSAATSIFQW